MLVATEVTDMAKRSIHIVGGAASIGRWLIEKAFSSHSSVYCYDLNKTAPRNLPREITGCALDTNSMYEPYESNFQCGD